MSWSEEVDDERARFVIRSRIPRDAWAVSGLGLLAGGVISHYATAAVSVLVGVIASGGAVGSTRLWRRAVVELDRAKLVVRSGREEQLREPTIAVLGFAGGQWSRAPQRARNGQLRQPPPEWTVFVSLDDGRQVPFDVALRDDAEATALAASLERALGRLRAPKSYRG